MPMPTMLPFPPPLAAVSCCCCWCCGGKDMFPLPTAAAEDVATRPMHVTGCRRPSPVVTTLWAKMGGGGVDEKVANCDGCDMVTPVTPVMVLFVPNIGLVEYMGRGWCARSICGGHRWRRVGNEVLVMWWFICCGLVKSRDNEGWCQMPGDTLTRGQVQKNKYWSLKVIMKKLIKEDFTCKPFLFIITCAS